MERWEWFATGSGVLGACRSIRTRIKRLRQLRTILHDLRRGRQARVRDNEVERLCGVSNSYQMSGYRVELAGVYAGTPCKESKYGPHNTHGMSTALSALASESASSSASSVLMSKLGWLLAMIVVIIED